MKSLMMVAMAGIMSYNTMGAYDIVRDTIHDIDKVYQSAYNINFFAPATLRLEQEQDLFDQSAQHLNPITVASRDVADRSMEPQEIIYRFEDRMVFN